MTTCYLNGQCLPLAEARISPLDRGFLFGDGAYEVIPVYSRRPFRIGEHLHRLQQTLDGIRLPNPHSIAEWAERVERIIAAIVTLGPRLEHAVRSSFDDNDPLLAIILDMAGIILIRNASTHFQRECATRAGAIGLELGPRVSPGCQAVPLEAQKALFSLLDAQSIGVTLTDSLLMTPVKSVSVILPLAASLPERLKVFSMCLTPGRTGTPN